MPNQFKCNDLASSEDAKINSFNTLYEYYYDTVIKKKNGNGLFNVNDIDKIKTGSSSILCDIKGCPSNISKDTVTQSLFFYNVDKTNPIIRNADLEDYLNDCASKINLNKKTSPYYGGRNGNYDKTMTLRDTTYNTLLNDRSDLDRKMKEVLALEGAMVNEHQTLVDGSVYTTLLWTVMATSLIYYVFTKI